MAGVAFFSGRATGPSQLKVDVNPTAVVAILHIGWFYPILARFCARPTPRWEAPLRRIDVTAEYEDVRKLAHDAGADVRLVARSAEAQARKELGLE